MTEYRGITGTFHDFKLIKTRGYVQVIIEVPIEQGDRVLESLGGLPVTGKERHVCVGLYDKLMDIAEGRATGPDRHANLSLVGKERYAQADEEKRAVIRAATLPKDKEFWAWAGVDSEVEAIDYIHKWIGGSRSLIATDRSTYHAFITMETEFELHAGRVPEIRA
jgi:hypothetical protein